MGFPSHPRGWFSIIVYHLQSVTHHISSLELKQRKFFDAVGCEAHALVSTRKYEITFYLIKLASIIFVLLLKLRICYIARVCVSFVAVMI